MGQQSPFWSSCLGVCSYSSAVFSGTAPSFRTVVTTPLSLWKTASVHLVSKPSSEGTRSRPSGLSATAQESGGWGQVQEPTSGCWRLKGSWNPGFLRAASRYPSSHSQTGTRAGEPVRLLLMEPVSRRLSPGLLGYLVKSSSSPPTLPCELRGRVPESLVQRALPPCLARQRTGETTATPALCPPQCGDRGRGLVTCPRGCDKPCL